jgi:predicted Zn-dependent protease
MIGALIDDLSRRVSAADLVEHLDDTLTITVDSGGDVELEHEASSTLHVRVQHQGRLGWAGGAAAGTSDVVSAALASARGGAAGEVPLPAPSPVAAVTTASPAAAQRPIPELLSVARGLRDRLSRRGWRVEAWLERSVGTVRVANTRGVMVEYDRTLVGLGATVRAVDPVLSPPLRLHLAEIDVPPLTAVERLVTEFETWLGYPPLDDWSGPGETRAWFRPRAARCLLSPVLARLLGESWLAGQARGESLTLDAGLTIVDDPLAAGRPGSRPVCDDGVVTRAITLLDCGRPVQGIVDLMTAFRHGVPATGHGLRPALGAPRASYSNLAVKPGGAAREELAHALGDGVLLADLGWGAAPSRSTGAFRAVAPWTFLVRDGEIVGRLNGAVVGANAFQLLARVGAIGADAEWLGAWSLPSLVVEGLAVTTR